MSLLILLQCTFSFSELKGTFRFFKIKLHHLHIQVILLSNKRKVTPASSRNKSTPITPLGSTQIPAVLQHPVGSFSSDQRKQEGIASTRVLISPAQRCNSCHWRWHKALSHTHTRDLLPQPQAWLGLPEDGKGCALPKYSKIKTKTGSILEMGS